MNIPDKLSIGLAIVLMLGGASVAVAKAPHHKYHPTQAYRAYGAVPYGTFAAPPRYRAPINGCRLRWGERPEELTQDRDFQESLGYDC
jgi:hypothetical protein